MGIQEDLNFKITQLKAPHQGGAHLNVDRDNFSMNLKRLMKREDVRKDVFFLHFLKIISSIITIIFLSLKLFIPQLKNV